MKLEVGMQAKDGDYNIVTIMSISDKVTLHHSQTGCVGSYSIPIVEEHFKHNFLRKKSTWTVVPRKELA